MKPTNFNFTKCVSLSLLCAAAILPVSAQAAAGDVPGKDVRILQVLSSGPGADAALPTAAIWKQAPVAKVSLQTAFPGHPSIVGKAATELLSAQAIRSGDMLYLRLQWKDKSQNIKVLDTDQFVDQVAVQFPLNGELTTTPFMGDGNNAVNIWRWRADGHMENIFASGFGTATPVAVQGLTGNAVRHSDSWDVVLARPLTVKSDEGVRLKGRKMIPVAFAAWDGGGQERDGFKAVTLEWWQMKF